MLMLYDRTPIYMNYTTIYISYRSVEKYHSENGERLVFCKKTQQKPTTTTKHISINTQNKEIKRTT
jgi:hypothetical protein